MKKNSFLKSGSYLLISVIFAKAIAFILNILCARFLDKESFGQLSFIRNTVAMFEGLVSGSNGNLIISSLGNKNYYSSIILSCSFYISISILVFILLLKTSYGGFVLIDNYSFLLMIAMFLSSSFLGVINSIYIAHQENKVLVISSFFSGIVSFIICTLLIYYGNYHGALLAYVVYFSIDLLFKIYFIFKKVIRLNFSRFVFDISILNRSFQLLIFTSMSLCFFWYIRNKLVIEKNGLSELAEFELVYQFVTIALLAIGAFTSTMLSKISNESGILIKTIIISLVFGFTSYLIACIFGETLFKAINPLYNDIGTLIPYAVFIIFPYTASSIVNKFLIIHRLEYISVYSSFIAVLICSCFFFLNKPLSAMILSILYCVYYFSVTAISLFSFFILKKIRPN
ncbi:oligosaccharide flippase family protein [Proteus columbae]|uniref:oligosaccharide flippase family protein n=1 Tax=Proteus columbae TaxID=1987580 RepID=UPI00288BEC15|nr:oligosaccharide flippase family protein [Proteus columbae]